MLGDQPWDFFGRNDANAETPVLWPPHAELTHWKRLWCWEGLGQEEKGTTEDEMAGWHHGLHGHEFEWTPGVSDGQGGPACCDSWGHKESDMTEWLNWTENLLKCSLKYFYSLSSSILLISAHAPYSVHSSTMDIWEVLYFPLPATWGWGPAAGVFRWQQPTVLGGRVMSDIANCSRNTVSES